MTFIRSISGFRGTIGGAPGQNLTPIDIVESTSAFVSYLQKKLSRKDISIVIGRDGRMSGEHVLQLAIESIRAMGAHAVNLDLSTTPTVELAVIKHRADGGIICTASHNPREWNALKLINDKGEFISASAGTEIIRIASERSFSYANIDDWGNISTDTQALTHHINLICRDELILRDQIRNSRFHIVVDGINSTGNIAIPKLLEALGCTYHLIHGDIHGDFEHNPEPLETNLHSLMQEVLKQGADLGIAVDPDVDRLAFVDHTGTYIGEEYTLVAAADYISDHRKGTFVSNLSSSMALQDIVTAKGCTYESAAVGEVNVVAKMKEVQAVLGGEGNGGVIYPPLHHGRDALVGIALILSLLVYRNKSLHEIRKQYPNYVMVKEKMNLPDEVPVLDLLDHIATHYKSHNPITIDGVKIVFNSQWVHIRPSNTEPILRLYAEATHSSHAKDLIRNVRSQIQSIVKKK